MFAALLDTSVLWPSLQRDFLLSLGIEGLYRPLWSEAVLEELAYHEAAKRRRRGEPDAQERAERLLQQMRLHFADALVEEWEQVAPYGLPDPDDEHVLAAAVVGGAGALVTANVKDFPRHLVPTHIAVLSPAVFARDAVSVDPDRAVRALTEMSKRRQGQTTATLLTLLETRYFMHEAVDLIRALL